MRFRLGACELAKECVAGSTERETEIFGFEQVSICFLCWSGKRPTPISRAYLVLFVEDLFLPAGCGCLRAVRFMDCKARNSRLILGVYRYEPGVG